MQISAEDTVNDCDKTVTDGVAAEADVIGPVHVSSRDSPQHIHKPCSPVTEKNMTKLLYTGNQS